MTEEIFWRSPDANELHRSLRWAVIENRLKEIQGASFNLGSQFPILYITRNLHNQLAKPNFSTVIPYLPLEQFFRPLSAMFQSFQISWIFNSRRQPLKGYYLGAPVFQYNFKEKFILISVIGVNFESGI